MEIRCYEEAEVGRLERTCCASLLPGPCSGEDRENQREAAMLVVRMQGVEKLHFTSCIHGGQLSPSSSLACSHSFPSGSQRPHLPLPQTSNSALVCGQNQDLSCLSCGQGVQEGLHSKALQLAKVTTSLIT